ncbi:hypothetical protein DFJ73DRAFT_774095 [Zopfochytrium polystomum]|nr:hypothetical protein DFJ73DRAFT_774095 [Zopfochytrium polystomum]
MAGDPPGICSPAVRAVSSKKLAKNSCPHEQASQQHAASASPCCTTTLNLIAVDLGSSLAIGEDAMNDLTGGQAETLGRVAATVVEVDTGMSSGFASSPCLSDGAAFAG